MYKKFFITGIILTGFFIFTVNHNINALFGLFQKINI